jgi:hypothetical protein
LLGNAKVKEKTVAAGWLTALKVIPWGDVIEAAPGIVKGARRFFVRTQDADTALAHETPGDAWTGAQARISELETRVAELIERQQASAELIESLAEQNAKVVQAIEILRMRTRLLLICSGVLALAMVAMAWVVWR